MRISNSTLGAVIALSLFFVSLVNASEKSADKQKGIELTKEEKDNYIINVH